MNEVLEIYKKVGDFLESRTHTDEDVHNKWTYKKEHSYRVAEISEKIALSLEMEEDEVALAKLLGLIHDVGRFKQYEQFSTFNDGESVDHGETGKEEIVKQNWLEILSNEEQNLILDVVFYHNKGNLPKNITLDQLLYLKIIRDADKLDILKQAIVAYSPGGDMSLYSEFDVTPAINEALYKRVKTFKMPDKKDIKTLNDFKLFQMTYVFDLNYKYSFNIINKEQYLKKIFDTMPKNDIAFDTFRVTKIHVENNLF